MKRVSVRSALLAAITRDVGWLVERDRFRDLEAVMEATGYGSNRSWSTSRRMGAAIIALCSSSAVVERSWLENTAHTACFYRHYSGRRSSAQWHRADARADAVLRDAGIDVDARNAKEAAESERITNQAVH